MFSLGEGAFWFVVYALLLVTGGVSFLILAFRLAPRSRNPLKEATFESGQVPPGTKRVRLVMQYFAFLLLFLIFDVVTMFLFAWGFSFFNYNLSQSIYVVILLLFLFPPTYLTLKVARNVGV